MSGLPGRPPEAAEPGGDDRGRNIAEIAALPIAECAAFLDDVELDDREAQIAERFSAR